MSYNLPDEKGHFDQYGGIFVAETLMTAVTELKDAYENLKMIQTSLKSLRMILNTMLDVKRHSTSQKT